MRKTKSPRAPAARVMGLLQKAHGLRSSSSVDGREEFVFEPDSGISREDQKDIIREIETVTTKSRIGVTPAAFAVKAAKRGILFPVLVNLFALLVLGGGLAVFYYFFQRGETQLTQAETGTITAEGKLIEQLKKDSEARLLAKNQEISQIQDRLAEIDKQRQDLQANMDAKVRERENQLKTSLAAELEAERARLRKQGLSEQEVTKRLSDVETQKNEEFAKQLVAYRAQAENEKQQADINLRALREEFNANLARTNQERQQVLEDSKKREADLQAQLEQRTREVESAKAQSDKALQALQSQRQQEELASGQLVGLYSVVKADIASRDYPKALGSLQAIKDYVSRVDVAVLPAIQQRRDVDLFVVDSLTGYVQGQLTPARADTSSLVAAAGQISDVRSIVAKADEQLRAGNIAEAENLYSQALAAIPEIAKSYAYFTDKAKTDEDARQRVLRAGLARAEAAYDNGRLDDMLAAYKEALAYLPETSARLDKVIANISAAGSQQGLQKTAGEQSRAAAPILAQGDAALARGQPADALARYLSILERYPQSPQAAAAVKGISNASAAMANEAAAKLAAREKDLAARLVLLEKQVTARGTELTGVKQSIMNLLGTTGDPAAQDSAALMDALTRRFGDLQSAQGASGDLATRLSKAESGAAALQKKIDALSSENERLKAAAEKSAADAAARQASLQQQPTSQAQTGSGSSSSAPSSAQELASLKAKLSALSGSYSSYTSREDPLLQTRGDKGLVDAKPYLDNFLGSPPVRETFPGLYDRIKRYDQGFLAAGRANAIQDMLDVIIELSKKKSPDGRLKFLADKLSASGSDPDMADLVKGLQSLMK